MDSSDDRIVIENVNLPGHRTASEIWLLLDDHPEASTVSYLDAVEEAICHWNDGGRLG